MTELVLLSGLWSEVNDVSRNRLGLEVVAVQYWLDGSDVEAERCGFFGPVVVTTWKKIMLLEVHVFVFVRALGFEFQ